MIILADCKIYQHLNLKKIYESYNDCYFTLNKTSNEWNIWAGCTDTNKELIGGGYADATYDFIRQYIATIIIDNVQKY